MKKKAEKVVTLDDKKLELTYPCKWNYRVIGESQEKVEGAIKVIAGVKDYTSKVSNTSKTGKYISIEVEFLVHSEAERQTIFEALKAHPDTKMVL